MAITKLLIASLVLFSLLLLLDSHVQATQTNQLANDGYTPKKIDCGGLCVTRCGKASRQNLCKRACGTCCSRCQCVPSGTSGNYGDCHCYASLTTRGNKPKCP